MSKLNGKLEAKTEMILKSVSKGPRGPAGSFGKDGKNVYDEI